MKAFTTSQRLWRAVGDLRQQVTTMGNIGELQKIMSELETARDTFNAVIQRSRDLHYARGEAYGHENLAAVEHDLGDCRLLPLFGPWLSRPRRTSMTRR